MTEPSVFDGFPPEGLQFLAGLAENNNRSWFDAHRSIYEECLQAPARALVLSLGEELRRRVSSGIRFEPRVGKSLFRINRDLRFTKDKTPYNPWLDAVFWECDDARSSPSFFLRLTADDVTVGAGIFRMQGSMLGRYRDAVLDDRLGPRLRRVLTAITGAIPHAELSTPALKRVPSGYPADHPHADLLRLDTLHASIREPQPASIHEPDFIHWCAHHHERFAALHQWLVRALC